MNHKKFTSIFLTVIFLASLFIFSIFNKEIRAESASEFLDSVGKINDSNYTGLGKVDYKPYKGFSSSEMVNLHNGNLFYKYTDITLLGKGIPLNITRAYNSSWHNPAFQGLVKKDTKKSNAYWGGEEFFNNDPQQDNIAGMKLAFTEYKMGEIDFSLGKIVPISYVEFNPGIAVDPASTAALWSFLYMVNILDWLSNHDIYVTTMMLTHPKNLLTINDVYAIIPKYPEHDEDADEIPQLAESTSFLKDELNLILKNGANISFKYNEKKEYIYR